MHGNRLPALLVVAALAACSSGREEPTSAPPAADTGGVGEQLEELVEGYFEESLELNPVFATYIGDNRYNDRFANDIGPEYREQSRALEQRYLDAVRQLDPAALAGQDRLSYEIFERNRILALEGLEHPDQLVPVNQFFSIPNFFAQMGSGSGIQPFETVQDYENFLGRIDGFEVWIEQAITNMREGMKRGIVQPEILMERVLPQLAAQVTDEPRSSLFYRPIENMPQEFSEANRERLTAMYEEAIAAQLIESYRKLHDFIRDEYMPHARRSVGLSDIPGGADWYAYLVRNTTTTELTPDEIHAIGLSEVERIHAEMEKVMSEVGFEGDLGAFFEFMNSDPRFYFEEKEDLLDGYRALRETVHPAAPNLFEALPRADYEIRAVEPFREKSASGGAYQIASPDGSRPGIFYVNTYDLQARPKWAMESLFLHEAVPGHHFQRAIALELTELPRFRRFASYTAYGEGWGLYAESLGKELGVYQDPYQYFGALNAELWRAIRLVVDTGLHHKGWTREQVLDFMYANSAVKEARAVAEAERYIAIPSQALAYKIGQLEISRLRTRAEEALGENFDIKSFHAQVLEDGQLPLDVLEAKIERWIADQPQS